jgi:hypothetical protein
MRIRISLLAAAVLAFALLVRISGDQPGTTLEPKKHATK